MKPFGHPTIEFLDKGVGFSWRAYRDLSNGFTCANSVIGSMSQTTKPKSAKKGDDFSDTCSDIIPYKGGLPPISNIVLKSSPLPSTRPRFSKHSTIGRPKPPTPKPSVDASSSSKNRGNKRKTSLPTPSATAERRVCCL